MTALPPPDPQLGVFETMLVHGGRPIELDAHFERLAASLETLFGGGIPSALVSWCSSRRAASTWGACG